MKLNVEVPNVKHYIKGDSLLTDFGAEQEALIQSLITVELTLGAA